MKEIQLTRPSDHDLDDAYRHLSKGGNILAEIEPYDLINTLRKLEGIGFVGIEIPYYIQEGKWVTISGFKGKHGPCFNTGMKASYTGSALAAFDDDNHLLIKGKESAICEKTGMIYRFSPYRGLISISEGSQEMIEQLKSTPAKFDLYSLDDELIALYKHLKHNSGQQDRVFAFYPGPFRSLILNDGTIVHRGEVNSVPKSELKDLVKNDRFIKFKEDIDVDPVFFQEEYIQLGPGCLQMNQKVHDLGAVVQETDINELDFHSLKLLPRLIGLIDQNRNCFILTGSDPADEMGCCPSDEVGEANRLVEAGVLSAVSQEVYGDACPVSYYAFKDEISIHNGEVQFKKNQEIRKRVYLHLNKNGPSKYKSVIRWILLGFVLVSLVFAVLKMADNPGINEHYSLNKQLSLSGDDTILILLFHNRVRCTMCRNMEQYIHTLMLEDYAELVENKKIQFFLMDMNKPVNKSHIERFSLYTASVVIVKMVDKQEVETIILNDIWEHHNEGIVFKERITKELETLLTE